MVQGTTSCSIEDCSRHHWSRGMCSLHYQRWRRHGSADVAFRAANGASAAGCFADGCGYVDPHGLVRGLCRAHYQREQYNAGRPAPGRLVCTDCGESYQPTHRDKLSIYCSRKCKDHARSPVFTRTCPHCGEQFTTRRSTQLLCSKFCRAAAHRLQSKFRSRVGEPTRPGIWRAEIAKRDGWHCGICGMPVNPKAQYPDPLQATLDHIVPVTRGGTNDPNNLRLAHMGCNRSRGNRMEAHASL